MSKNDDFIEKATKHGISVPYSCKNGMCATCRCKVSSGEVIMRKNFSLEDWEIKKGFMLSCQLEPVDKEICLDFDIIQVKIWKMTPDKYTLNQLFDFLLFIAYLC